MNPERQGCQAWPRLYPKPDKPMIYLDIETEALPEAEIQHLMPRFEAPSNYKDPEKIAANIAEQKAKWLEAGALSPITGRVLAIGYRFPNSTSNFEIHSDVLGEAFVLSGLLNVLADEGRFTASQPRLIGWNVKGFDIPFLIKRGWKHGIKFPKWLTAKPSWSEAPAVLDLMEEFKAGDWKAPYTSLDVAARFLGLEGKLGSGKDFAALYRSDKAAALAYLRRDVELLEAIHGRICE